MKKYVFFVLLMFSVPALLAQSTFIRTYGYEGAESAFTLTLTNDNGFLVGGTAANFTSGDVYPWIIKITQTGDTAWSRTFEAQGLDSCYSIVTAADGSFLMTASTENLEPALVKLDATGAVSWQKTGPVNIFALRYTAAVTADGGYILSGNTPANPANLMLIKISATGDTTWKKNYGGSGFEHGTDVIQTSDLGYFVAGYAMNSGTNYDVYYLRTDASGDTLWTRTHRKTNVGFANAAVQTADGGFLICGAAANTTFNPEPFLRKIDANGDSLWMKTAASSFSYNDIDLAADGSILLCGASNNILTGNSDGFLTKLSSTGVAAWSNTFGGSDAEALYALNVLSNGNIITCGETRSSGAGDFDYYVILADETGFADAIRELSMSSNSLRFSPNPTNGIFTINLSENVNIDLDITVYDGFGKIVRQVRHSFTDALPVSIDLSNQASGIYYIRAQSGPRVMTGKVMVE